MSSEQSRLGPAPSLIRSDERQRRPKRRFTDRHPGMWKIAQHLNLD